jgi:outer membrane protein OmpA-like peptidoglycan-associated protein
MSIQDISKLLGVCLILSMASISEAQKESVKFNAEVLDTALKVIPAKRINTKGLEFSPTYYKNGIVYVSVDEVSKRELKRGEAFISLKYAPLNEEGMPIAPVPFAIDERTRNHRGPVAFSNEENRMYLSRSNMEEQEEEDEAKSMKVYALNRGDTFWVDQEEMPFNIEGYTSFHPTISEDGTFMVFSSNRPGGYGRYDLYGAEKIDGQWSEPFNLGPKVNSRRNEAFPFLYKGKYLFYSSDRRGGEGEEDFYWSKRDQTEWSPAKNLGTPFNSEGAEVGIAFHDNGKEGFFSSDRKDGEGGDDIYAFNSSVHLFEDQIPLEPEPMTVQVVNQANQMRLSNTSIWLFPVDEKGLIIDRSAYKTKIVEDLETEALSLEVERKKAGELDPPDYVTNRNGQAEILLSPNTTYSLIAFKPGYKEIDTLVSLSGDETLLKLPLEEISCLPLEIEAIGPKNQKTEHFKVKVNNIQSNEYTTYDFPETGEICVTYNKAYNVIGWKKGYVPDTFQISPQSKNVKKVAVLFRLIPETGEEASMDIEEVDEGEKEVKKGATIVLNNIYYDYNKSSIRVGAEEELDALARIMKNFPSMKIELSAHTDSRGGELYNLKLSLRRAESAKEYLVAKGIVGERIQAIGYGESRIRNRCTDDVECTDKEHQYNRRTEIKIVELDKQVDIRHKEGMPNK